MEKFDSEDAFFLSVNEEKMTLVKSKREARVEGIKDRITPDSRIPSGVVFDNMKDAFAVELLLDQQRKIELIRADFAEKERNRIEQERREREEKLKREEEERLAREAQEKDRETRSILEEAEYLQAETLRMELYRDRIEAKKAQNSQELRKLQKEGSLPNTATNTFYVSIGDENGEGNVEVKTGPVSTAQEEEALNQNEELKDEESLTSVAPISVSVTPLADQSLDIFTGAYYNYNTVKDYCPSTQADFDAIISELPSEQAVSVKIPTCNPPNEFSMCIP